MSASFKGQLWLALAAITMAIMILTAIAIAASTRLGQVMTLCITLGVFLLGMLSDWVFGRQLARINSGWLGRARLEGLTETIEVAHKIELGSGEISETFVEREVATVPLTRMAEGLAERIEYWFYSVSYAIVPDFQVFWLSDAVTQDHVIPPEYLILTLVYGPLQILIALSLAVMLFQRREVG